MKKLLNIKLNMKFLTKYKHYKRILDLIFSLIIVIIGFHIFLIIIVLIKFSSYGPIFFLQERIGKNKRKFKCIKFRTMHPEAEDILNKLLSENESIRNEFMRDHKIKNDPRITPIGKILRKTSLDELPQLLNVIKGDMSIIGPRPIVSEEIKKYGSKIDFVLSIKPGITGLWQVSGRNKLSYKKRVYLDCIYVKGQNFLIDVRILIRTFGVILFPFDRGAY